jgi:GTP-binding protein
VGFRREKFVPKGGPDGGDGGRGGDVIARGNHDMHSLMDYRFKRHFRAKHGQNGRGSQMTGASADPLILPVPLGTVFHDQESGKVLGEITAHDQELLLQAGGKGGLGNQHFKSSTNQAPRKATPGKKIEGFWLSMELKILADIGLVGFPNAGKSTFLQTVTQARPKIGDYAFTTLIPSIGVAELDGTDQRLIIADIPGIIEDAHQGVGLGLRFLRHIERCRGLLFLLNGDPIFEKDPIEQFEVLCHELEAYQKSILDRTMVVAINKSDLYDEKQWATWQKYFTKKNLSIHAISCHNQDGVEKLQKTLHEIL